MSETRYEHRIERDMVVTMLHAAGLAVDEERLEALARLLEAASDAASNLDGAAARIPLQDALAVFDPAWPAAERRA